MTLFVKNTDTAIMGLKATADVVLPVHGLADDGLPIFGEPELMQETPEIEIRDNAVIYVTAEGDTYPDRVIEDRREDGSVLAARVMPPARPITIAVAAAWRHAVAARQTKASLVDWAEGLTDGEFLKLHGLYLSERDWRINRATEGAWQVTELYTDGTVTEDARNGPWAIVGNDRALLVREALQQILFIYRIEE